MMASFSAISHEKYLKANQRGTVRWEAGVTPAYIEGLCTDNLRVCFGIIIMASEGKKERISLTHVDRAVDEKAILAECLWIGHPSTIFLIRGQDYKSPYIEAQFRTQSTLLPRIKRVIDKLPIKIDYSYFDRFSRILSVTKKGEIEFPIVDSITNCIQAPDWQFRLDINLINTIISNENSPGTKCCGLDLQFDGSKWTEMPKLTPESQNYLAVTKRSSLDWVLKWHVDSYRSHIAKFSQRSSLDSKEQAAATIIAPVEDIGLKLRKASADNNLSETEYLALISAAKEAKVIDNQSTNRRTALHWAADRGHQKIVSILLEAKADITIRDKKGQTALECAKEKGHEQIKMLLEGGIAASAPPIVTTPVTASAKIN